MGEYVLIIGFTNIQKDARIWRQILYLKERYEVAVAGYGQNPFPKDVEFINLGFIWSYRKMNNLDRLKLITSSVVLDKILLFKLNWIKNTIRRLDEFCVTFKPDLVICNDWNTLPIGFYLKEKYNLKIIYDSHEFAQKEWEDSFVFRFFIAPLIKKIEDEYVPKVDEFITVNESIAKEYSKLYGIHPKVVRNIPQYRKSRYKETEYPIKIVHHGGAIPSRKLENLIYMMKYLSWKDFELHLYLVGNTCYINKLKIIANSLDNNIYFHKPVPQDIIINELNKYDIGISYCYPSNLNYYYALPNKFFDFMMAGLGIVTPPLPEQVKIVEKFRLGVIATDFSPKSLAEAISVLTIDDIKNYKRNSLKASKILNAENEMKKFLKIVEKVLGD
jgi:hypothetical protein